MKLVIGNKNYSSWSLRPWLLLSFHEVAFEEIRIALLADNYKQQIHEYSVAGFVPVLKDESTTVWDSLAICEYISECYLSGRGWPIDPHVRAQARSCSAEMHSGFANIRRDMPMNVRAMGRKIDMSPEIEKEVTRLDHMWADLRLRYSSQGPWLFGDFSIADCMFAPMVLRFHTYGVRRSDESNNYMETMLQHPALTRWTNEAKDETEVIELAEVGR